MDMQILRDLFEQCFKSAELLGRSRVLNELASVRARLAPMQIGRAGQLQEWLEDWDLEAPERSTVTRRTLRFVSQRPNKLCVEPPDLFGCGPGKH